MVSLPIEICNNLAQDRIENTLIRGGALQQGPWGEFVLKNILASKLYQIIGGKASKGVKNILGEEVIPKSEKFTKKMLLAVDFTLVDPYKWTGSQENNI